jgi:TolB-like protein/Flp pilus assembly protein TadD
MYCLEDGVALVQGSVPSSDETQTAILHETAPLSDAPTRAHVLVTEHTAVLPSGIADVPKGKGFDKRLLVAPLVVVVLALGGFFDYRYVTQAKQIESIAVMPFVNESGNADLEYLSDGMAETLISSLTRLPNLNVKPRSAVFHYKGQEKDAQTIGKELNVQAVLNGSVTQRGQDISLYVELIDVAFNKAVWSQTYNRKQSDLVSLQAEVARDISGKLKSTLSGADTAKVEKSYTTNPEAFQLYLKGRFYWNKRTTESLKQAVEYFNQAIEKDPNYAPAYSGLAECYVLFTMYSIALPTDCMPKAKAAALKAIEIDDSFAETHTALGIYYSNFAWNQAAAEREFRRAIELNPDYAAAHQQFAVECLTAMGRIDDALVEARRAAELDPLSPIIGSDLGIILSGSNRVDEGIKQLNYVTMLDPNFWVPHWYIGITYYGSGRYAEAVAEYRKALSLDNNPWTKSLLIQALAKTGEREEATKLLDELRADAGRRYVASSSLAIAYGSLGDKEKAFVELEKSVEDRSARPSFFVLSPVWNDLKGDPRFAELQRKIEQAKLD